MTTGPVAAQRVLKGAQVDFSVQIRDQNGEAAAPAGTVTIDITKADGTAVVSGAATAGASAAPRTYALAASSNAAVELLTAVWKDGGTERTRTLVEVVGGFYFSIAEVEAFDTSLGDITDGSTTEARARRVRDEVERECERITCAAWVPRYRRIYVDGSGTDELVLPEGLWAPRTVRSVRNFTTATDYTAFTSTELAALEVREHRLVVRRDAALWPRGRGNLLLEVEHGFDQPPQDLRHAAMTRFRGRWNMEVASPGAENFDRMTRPDGSSWDLSDDTVDIAQREVWRVYKQHSKRTPGLA